MFSLKRNLFKNRFAKQKERIEPVEPWRDYKDLRNGWDREYCQELLAKIKETTTSILGYDNVYSETVNIVMLGYVQSGKSSTINSIFSITDREITKRTKAFWDVSWSKKYDSFPGERELNDIVLFDNTGIDGVPNYMVSMEDIISCINGQIEDNYHFDPRSKKEKVNNVLDEEMHCFMYCVDAESVFPEIIETVQKRMQEIESEMKIYAQDRIVLVTKIDRICDETNEDIRNIFHSNNIKKAVENAASIFNVSLDKVFPIKNYTEEYETDAYKNIPLLLALQRAVDSGAAYLRNKADAIYQLHKQTETEIFADLLFFNASLL